MSQSQPQSQQQGQSQPKRIRLSTRGLERAASVDEQNFTIVVGSNQFSCSKFQTAFISPAIAQLLQIDSTIERFVIDDIGIQVEVESQNLTLLIQDLLHRGSFAIHESQMVSISRLICQLKNEEIPEQLGNVLSSIEEMNEKKCIERYRLKRRLNIESSTEQNFICCHFYEIDQSKIEDLSKDELEDIMKEEESLRLESEDWFVSYLISRGSTFYEMFRHVRFEHLGVEGISTFLRHFSYLNLDDDIWLSLCRRLRHRIVDNDDDDDLSSSRVHFTCEVDESSPWSGIISHMTTRFCGNVHMKHVVNITSSGDSWNKCYRVCDHGWNCYWYTDNVPNSWIQFEFMNSMTSLTGYTLKSGSDGGGSHHLLRWKVEGSKNGRDWKQIDNQNCQFLNGNYVTKIFRCKSSNVGQFYRFIRLTQTGTNSGGNHHLMLCNIEFYGTVHFSQSH
jgi:hypothetical protein